MNFEYDMIIVGGGPGGATTALYAEQVGLKALLVDKKHFPRDKICGDAISGKSISYLKELDLLDELDNSPQEFVDSVMFSSPKNSSVTIPLPPNAKSISQGYVCRRMVFDNIIFQAAKKKVDTLEGFSVVDVLKSDEQVVGIKGKLEDGTEKEITGKIVVGADGFSSIISRKMGLYEHDPDHLLVATRAYYRGITGLSNAIELHYIKSILPGYFWIFPLENGLANVGLGMVHRALKKKGVRLKHAHVAATEAPEFRERFKDAELLGDIQGWNLPAGSKRRTIHGNGFLLVGDAASLIDPFTGEGIGNAMCSGKIAAQTVAGLCRNGNDFSAAALATYPKDLWKALGGELNLAYKLQRTARITPLVNMIVDRASKNQEVRKWMSDMMAGTVSKRDLLSPMTYTKLIFK